MSENSNNVKVLVGEMDFETSDHVWQTLKRMWRPVSDQHRRLASVLMSVIPYMLLSTIASLYSVRIINLFWNNTKKTVTTGTAFQATRATGSRDVAFLLLIYLVTALFYIL